MSPTRVQISVMLDAVSGAALDALIADGTSIGDAVRAAIVTAAHLRPEPALRAITLPMPGEAHDQWLWKQLEAAPPLSEQQIEVLGAVFVADRRRTPTRTRRTPPPWTHEHLHVSDMYDRLDRMGSDQDAWLRPKVGRPPRHLLSGIAVCGVCDAPLRVGAQNSGTHRRSDAPTEAVRYRVYECAGLPGQTGFHVSMRQERLDRLVTDAVLTRIAEPRFPIPRKLRDKASEEEREALRLQIKADEAWLETVREEADVRGWTNRVLRAQEDIVLPKIERAQRRIRELEELDPEVAELHRAFPVAGKAWKHMSVMQRPHVVQTLVVPRVDAVLPHERGQRGINHSRVNLAWL